jgi:putative nucleotidyltransferase with HDIG domain
MRTWIRGPLSALVVALAFKVFADQSARFAEAYGASYLFPSAAVVLTAGAVLRGWGIAGIFAGSLLSRWGAAAVWPGDLLFALVHALTAAVPAYGLGVPVGSTLRRVGRLLVRGVGAAFLVSALAGTAVLVALGYLRPEPALLAENLLLWWTADVIAAVALGLPLVLLLRPALVTDRPSRVLFAAWLRDGARVGASIGALVVAVAFIAGLDALGFAFPHWAAILFVVPIGLAALHGGLGPALLANAAVSVAYLALLFGTGSVDARGTLVDVAGPLYLILVFFACFALGGGVLGGHNRILLDRVRRQREQLERDFTRVVSALAAAIEAKDATTEGHVQRVAALAEAIGRELGLGPEELETLRYGAILHDVGKIGVPESVLNKPGELTAEEREAIEKHVEIGVQILTGIDILEEVIPLVTYHQERWDGRTDGVRFPGYFGLCREQIPLGARILAVVDTFDAITHDRPYRAGRSSEVALAELEAEVGKQFDPAVVQALVRVVHRRLGTPEVAAERSAAPPG